jgi:hypothetical protein
MAEYEFDAKQDAIINGFSARLITQAILSFLIGAVQLFTAIIFYKQGSISLLTVAILQAFFLAMIGVVFFPPSLDFRKVTTTKGTDITEMMRGLSKLKWGFGAITILVLLSVICDIFIVNLT